VSDFHLSAANFPINLVVGRRAHFKLMKLIVNSWMKTNMIARAWNKDGLVDLGAAGGFGALKKFTGKKRRYMACMCVCIEYCCS
jgi:hypothetical protein